MTDSPDGASGGTAVDKALMDAVLDTIDDQCHSTTNTTIKPKAITDEVKAARGNKSSLSARLLVAMDLDGNPTSSAALTALETEVQNARGGEVNLDTRLDLVDALLSGAKGNLSTIDARLDRTMDADGYINNPYAKTIKHTAGTGSATGAAPLTFSVDSTTTGNVGAGEDTLQSITLPANSLDENGDTAVFEFWGYVANNANSKAIKFQFGATSTTVYSAVLTNCAWKLTVTVVRLTSTTQKIYWEFLAQNAGLTSGTIAISPVGGGVSASETLSGAVTVLLTGEATSNNDIVKTLAKAKVE